MKPKHHLALHLPQQILQDGILLDTFTHERKHKALKAVANAQNNINTTLELNVVSSVLYHQLHEFEQLTSAVAPNCRFPPGLVSVIGCQGVLCKGRVLI